MKSDHETSIKDLADAIRRDFDPSIDAHSIGRTVLLIGAGCSFSAGIPLAKQIAQSLIVKLAFVYGVHRTTNSDPDLALSKLIQAGHFDERDVYEKNEDGTSNIDWSIVYDRIFSTQYSSPKEVRRIFSEIFEDNGNSINWTHICIGELVRIGYISTVLTTNFDQLVLEGIARTGRLPIVADGLEYLGRITGDSNQPQLVQIHGSRHTYHLRNSIEDTNELSENVSARHTIDEIFRTARVFIAVGYGGREKGIMELLIEAGERYPDTRIFWCSYIEKFEQLGPLVQKFLQTSKHSKVITGFDSDTLFDSILNEIGITEPKIIQDPLHLVHDLTNSIVFAKNSSISEKISQLQVKVADLKVAEAHMTALSPSNENSTDVANLHDQKMQAVGQLAGGLAHDFNNILTAIIGFSDLVLSNKKRSDPDFQDIINIKQNANRGANLVRQLLAFSRKQRLEPTALMLSGLVLDLKMLLNRLVGDKIEIDYIFANDLWYVKADNGQIEQVIVNLIVNARDAIPKNGSICLELSNFINSAKTEVYDKKIPEGEFVLVSISDNGCGIEVQNLQRIFDPFFTTKDVGKGTGLGLSTVFGIVKQSNGFIVVDSELGSGSSFCVYLPRYDLTTQDLIEVSVQKADSSDHVGTEVILVVEDEEPVRNITVRALRSRGYQVIEAKDGVEALNKISGLKKSIDLILSDVVMPNMDGPTLLEKVRSINSEQKFLLISGYAEESFENAIEPFQPISFLPKPFTIDKLLTTVRDVLDIGT